MSRLHKEFHPSFYQLENYSSWLEGNSSIVYLNCVRNLNEVLISVVPRTVIILTKFLDSRWGGSITSFFWLFVKLYCRGRNNPCQRDNNAKLQLKQFNNGRSISHTDSVRLCDYRLIHTDIKEHREMPGTWAEAPGHSDLLPLGAATGQWAAHCQCETL